MEAAITTRQAWLSCRYGCGWTDLVNAYLSCAQLQVIHNRLLSRHLFKDDGLAHNPGRRIEQYQARYCHWGPDVLFSANDNTNPNQTGRRYAACIDGL